MRAPRFHCAKPAAFAKPESRLRTVVGRLCLLALVAALSSGSTELLHGQAQQSAGQAAKPNSGQANSSQTNSGQTSPAQSGAQDSQPQQNSGPDAGAPMVLGEGDDQGAPAEQNPAQPPAAQPAPAQSGENSVPNIDQPSAQQQAVPPAPGDAGSQSALPALVELPPGPPDSSDPRKLVNWECADLLKLASDLKLAVDKTSKDELSLSVVRKAGEIEQMAHKLRDDMRPTMAGKN